jgi:hypothetical protein
MQADIERVHANLDRTINGAAYSFGRQEAFEGRMDRISERIDILHP